MNSLANPNREVVSFRSCLRAGGRAGGSTDLFSRHAFVPFLLLLLLLLRPPLLFEKGCFRHGTKSSECSWSAGCLSPAVGLRPVCPQAFS